MVYTEKHGFDGNNLPHTKLSFGSKFYESLCYQMDDFRQGKRDWIINISHLPESAKQACQKLNTFNMSRAGDSLVRCCTRLNRVPAAILCVLVYILQACVLDYYLISYLGNTHLCWLIGDVLVLVLLVISIVMSMSTLERQKADEHADTTSFAWATWLVMHVILAAKVIVSFMNFSIELEESEETFFGPNTLKTAIALGSCVFLLLLTTQHDAPLASERRRYIEALTGTVFFDLLDTTDILEILFSEEDRDILSNGLEEAVLAVATLNLLLPTVPLLTLSKTKFGYSKLRKRMVYIHRILIILAVNVPNLLVRMVLWHGFSVGVSPFVLKNIILIVMTLFEFYEHKLEKFEQHEQEKEAAVELQQVQIQKPNDGGTGSTSLTPGNRCDLETGDSRTNDLPGSCYVDVRDGYAFPGCGDGPTRRSTFNGKSTDTTSPTITTL